MQAVLLSVLCPGLAMAQDSELKAVTNPAALYYSGYYPGTGHHIRSGHQGLKMIISGYYPGFRGFHPGYYNPYAQFGYPGYNLNFLNRNLLTRPLAFRPLAVPAPVAAPQDEAMSVSLVQDFTARGATVSSTPSPQSTSNFQSMES